MDLPTLHALLSPEGARLLEEVRAEYDGSNALALSGRLRRNHPADLVAAAMTQVDLRRRARAKLGPDADRMYFTAQALEQCTRRSVADHRATRLARHGVRNLLDLGCGIGGDLVAAGAHGIAVTGVEHDPLRADLARANLAALGLPGQIRVGRAEDAARTGFDAVFADPARRAGGRRPATNRAADPAAYSPSWDFVTDLLERGAGQGACVKVAPGIAHDLVPDGVEAEWVSDGGALKEAALWSGRLAEAGRRATLLGRGVPPEGVTLTEADDPGTADVLPVGAVVYEPDDAAIRAGLVTAVAAIVGGGLLDDRIAYLTSQREVSTPFARAYRVLEELPFREKALRAALRDRGVGTLTIKKRGVDVTPEVLRKRLGLRGDSAATIILTRVAGRGTTLLVDPIPNGVNSRRG